MNGTEWRFYHETYLHKKFACVRICFFISDIFLCQHTGKSCGCCHRSTIYAQSGFDYKSCRRHSKLHRNRSGFGIDTALTINAVNSSTKKTAFTKNVTLDETNCKEGTFTGNITLADLKYAFANITVTETIGTKH